MLLPYSYKSALASHKRALCSTDGERVIWNNICLGKKVLPLLKI